MNSISTNKIPKDNNNSYFEVKLHGITYTISFDHTDVTTEEFFQTCRSLALACGHHPDNVNQIIEPN